MRLNRCPVKIIKHDPVTFVPVFIVYELKARSHVKRQNPGVVICVQSKKTAPCPIVCHEKHFRQIQEQGTNPQMLKILLDCKPGYFDRRDIGITLFFWNLLFVIPEVLYSNTIVRIADQADYWAFPGHFSIISVQAISFCK